MGLKNYFKASSKKNAKAKDDEPEMAQQPFDDKAPTPFTNPGFNSSHASLTPSTKSNSRSSYMDEIRHEVMVNYLFQQQCAVMWIGDGSGESEGILVRKSKASYLACPPDLIHSVFAQSVMALNVPCAMTINSRVVKTYLAWSPNATDVPLKNGLRVQVLPNMEDLPRARKAQSAAFIAADGLLVVWDDGTLRCGNRLFEDSLTVV
jgi:hypothetical protein